MDIESQTIQGGEEETAVQTPDTATTEVDEGAPQQTEQSAVEQSEPAPADQQLPPTFTQEQVNDIIRERLNRYDHRVAEELGMGLEEAKSILSSHAQLQVQYNQLLDAYNALYRDRVFDQYGIDPDRAGDIDAIMKSRNMDFTASNLEQLLGTHPEWQRKQTTFQQVGAPRGDGNPQGETESERAARLFGLHGFVRK